MELHDELRHRRGVYSTECQRLLTAMSFQLVADVDKRVGEGGTWELRINKEKWTAADGNELRDTVRTRMNDTIARPVDLWGALLASAGAKRRLTQSQFVTAMKRVLGYKVRISPSIVCDVPMLSSPPLTLLHCSSPSPPPGLQSSPRGGVC